MQIKNQKLSVGTYWSWTESLSDYPASDYTLKIYLRQGSAAAKTITASASGDDHVIEEAAATTANYAFGDHTYQAVAENKEDATKKYEVERGRIHIYPNLSADTTDPRGPWEKIYAALSTALQNMAGREFASVSINGKAVTYQTRAELIRDLQFAKVQMEIETGKRSKENKTYLARFS